MRRNYFPLAILFFSLFMGGCLGPPARNSGEVSEDSQRHFAGNTAIDTAGSRFWNSMPSGDLVFIGGAGLRSNRDESIQLALLDIARKVSIFNSVEGQFTTYNKIGSSFFDYTMDTTSSLRFNEDYQGFAENLEYDPDTDIIQIENTIFVRARFKAPDPIAIPYRITAEYGSSRPLWIDNPPAEISGYRVGVGFAGRRAYHRDTVNASFEAAIFSIIKEISSQVSAGALNYQGSGVFDYRTTNDNMIIARGVLHSFYVLDTWIDPSNMTVWTLAIARTDG